MNVGEVAALAGVTVRTLHHYDRIGLLSPSGRTAAGYRRYSAADLDRLHQVLLYRELGFPLEEAGHVRGVRGEGVGAALRVGELAGLAHADQVRRDAAAQVLHVRDDVAPQVGRRRVAVQEDDRITFADVDVGHLRPAHGHPLPREGVLGRDDVVSGGIVLGSHPGILTPGPVTRRPGTGLTLT